MLSSVIRQPGVGTPHTAPPAPALPPATPPLPAPPAIPPLPPAGAPPVALPALPPRPPRPPLPPGLPPAAPPVAPLPVWFSPPQPTTTTDPARKPRAFRRVSFESKRVGFMTIPSLSTPPTCRRRVD